MSAEYDCHRHRRRLAGKHCAGARADGGLRVELINYRTACCCQAGNSVARK